MNAVVDIGNTLTKLGKIHEGNRIEVISGSSVSNILEINSEIRFDYLLVSSVRQNDQDLESLQTIATNVLKLDQNTALPFHSHYKTPETLGPDRLAGIAGSQLIFPKQNNLVIDCGTCITYDFLSSNSDYLGGGISPGMTMKFKALKEFTSKLPLVELDQISDLNGLSTKECINSGVLWGTVAEIQGIINRYQTKFGEMNVLLTGGDATYFESKINTPIFVRSNLVLEGLKGILEFNK
ncbi:MAG: type III pantothenate kinase [Bacteroidota bacterium]